MAETIVRVWDNETRLMVEGGDLLALYAAQARASAAAAGYSEAAAAGSAAAALVSEESTGTYLSGVLAEVGDLPVDAILPLQAVSRAILAGFTGMTAGRQAYLGEAGREGVLKWSTANHAADVTADPAQGVYVAPASDMTGASGAWVRPPAEALNVRWFGAAGDGVTDDRAAIQAALNYSNAIGGACIYFPAGTYKVSGYLTVYPHTRITGAGRKATKITTAATGGGGANGHENLRNGSIFHSSSTINGSTRVDIFIEDVWLHCSNGSNVGAGFYDSAGTFIGLNRVRADGFKYGVVLDQSELVHIDHCDFEGQLAGGSGIWLVNGTDLTPTALPGFTNQITVRDCQFNAGVNTYGVVDDGGASHTFQDNNFNACKTHIRAAGVIPLLIVNGEYESATGHIVDLQTSTLSGGGSGPCTLVVQSGLYAALTGYACFNIASAGSVSFEGVWFATPSGASIRGVSTCYQATIKNCTASFAADPIVDSYATVQGWVAMYSAAAPTLGRWGVGQIVWNSNPSSEGAPLGWRCVTAGAPGTWVEIAAPGSVAPGSKLQFRYAGTEVWGAPNYEGYIERVSVGDVVVTRIVSRGGVGEWRGGLHVQLSHGEGAVFDALKLDSTGAASANLDLAGDYMINGLQVVGSRKAAVSAPSGGTTVDAEARTAISDLISRLQAHGLIA